MKKNVLAMLMALWLCQSGFSEIQSLSHLFSHGRSILDGDGDGFGDQIRLTIIIPERPSGYEVALAADIAARANFESLVLDFDIVRKPSGITGWENISNPILIGDDLPWAKEILNERGIRPDSLSQNQGLVLAFEHKNRHGILCVGGSDETLLATGRAFFLRWPYFWEIWGRETGSTYFSLEEDLAAFLASEEIPIQNTIMREALFEFPVKPAVANALQNLSFDQGQIKNLTVEISFKDESDRDKALKAFERLREAQRRGRETLVLSYPGCAGLTIKLEHYRSQVNISMKRTGATKRLLTPRFKSRPPAEPSGKTFDLLGLYSSRGFYGDQNRDGILDLLETSVVIPGDFVHRGVVELVSRLMLDTAGGAFPITYLDTEIESRKSLPAPILIGANALTQELIRTGKMKPQELAEACGAIQVVPQAFGKSDALVIQAADDLGLDKTLSYFARTFPYLEEYGEGQPQFGDVKSDLQNFLYGEKGAAEAVIRNEIEKVVEELRGKSLQTFEAEITLPRPNAKFTAAVRRMCEEQIATASIEVRSLSLREGRTVFRKEEEFEWEVDDALDRIRKAVRSLDPEARDRTPLSLSLGVSESPQVRSGVKGQIEDILRAEGLSEFHVEVLSAYKPGFFWLTEKVLPNLLELGVYRLVVYFSEEKEDVTQPKRSYAEPTRWLQELYPVDEILSRDLGLPLENIEFAIRETRDPVYEVRAYNASNELLWEGAFSPEIRSIPFIEVLPEWGTVKVTSGWLRMTSGQTTLVDESLQTDLERFWSFYQNEVLRPAYSHILNNTGQAPTFSKQPYFKRLLVEVHLSEPDYRLDIDEEIVSSLEALHDEIYFDTLDFLRGITGFDPEDMELPPDTSRSSAPGNVLPRIYPSLEGGPGRTKILFEDWPGRSPFALLKWKEENREETSKRIPFTTLKPNKFFFSDLTFNGKEERLDNILIEMGWDKEADYMRFLDMLESYRELAAEGLIEDPFRYPKLRRIAIRLEYGDREKEEWLPVDPLPKGIILSPASSNPDKEIVPTREIISPSMCLDIADRLGQFASVRSYKGGESYEGRNVPVLEMYLPQAKYVSIPRLITYKPTLQLVGRQHANEVSSTNYLLKFIELLAKDEEGREILKKMNFAIQPMENPDGAELAFELHKIEPFHSLHSGRYSALGVDIGYRSGGARPLLPEAMVRGNLSARWRPDIFLNLHGYPSHEWVQPFSNYSPYLFRDYWIPRGWFTYYRALRLSIYAPWKEASENLMNIIVQELQADGDIRESNRKFYERYERWAGRWAPHMNALEIYAGVNIYAKRRSSSESRLSERFQMTFVEQTPELMDETATGEWLEFLCRQGLAYLQAHVKFLSQSTFDIVRFEEEGQGRVRISLLRGRPGSLSRTENIGH